ncbi:hypothetical protein Ahy_B10g100289 [Arachis hypogaea]|uniref:Uncharacterized protein n=1 Tax=Arachis hypogaea TaxID=3818 RepID=A0A444WWB7_ARAHY|nr:hypothetical protein Ahy_B10g100289 [Arachis hypogaea]
METETGEKRDTTTINNVMCLLTHPDGAPLGAPMYLPQNAGPQQLQLIVNKILDNGHKKWITGISWEPVHLSAPCRRFVSASKDGDALHAEGRRSDLPQISASLDETTAKLKGDLRLATNTRVHRIPCVSVSHPRPTPDCTIKVWETTQGKLIRELKGHGHWVNSLALSTEYVLRTGAFDHTGKQYSSPEEMKKYFLMISHEASHHPLSPSHKRHTTLALKLPTAPPSLSLSLSAHFGSPSPTARSLASRRSPPSVLGCLRLPPPVSARAVRVCCCSSSVVVSARFCLCLTRVSSQSCCSSVSSPASQGLAAFPGRLVAGGRSNSCGCRLLRRLPLGRRRVAVDRGPLVNRLNQGPTGRTSDPVTWLYDRVNYWFSSDN